MEQGVVESERTRVPITTMRFTPMSDEIPMVVAYLSVEETRHPTPPTVTRNPIFLTCTNASKSPKTCDAQLVSSKDLDTGGMISVKNLDSLLVVVFGDFELFMNGGNHFVVAGDCGLVNIHSRERVEWSLVQFDLVLCNWLGTFEICTEFIKFLATVGDNDVE